jgi:hypothetical protein
VTVCGVPLRGNESLIGLCGPRGVGKTVSCAYALGKLGGRYLTAYQFSRPGLDLEHLARVPLVVVDQLGREHAASEYAAASLEELLDARHSGRLLTILVGNLTRDQFVAHVGPIVEDRLKDGAFFALKGASRRGAR